MIVEALQTASRGETPGTQRPAAQNADASPPSQRVQQPAPEAKAQAGLPSPAQSPQVALAYHVDEKTRQVYFQIVDSQSGRVIRQVPPAEILAMEGQIDQFLEAAANARHPNGKGGGQ
jgi:flagellar protein FlaG